MRQSLNKIRPVKHIANRSPSPDISNNHLLVETKIVITKDTVDKRRQRVPIIQQITNLAHENQKLRQQLYDSSCYKIKRQSNQIEKDKSQSKIPSDKISKKINVTLSDIHLNRNKSFNLSSQSKTLNTNGQVQKLKGIISELIKQNNDLRKSIIKNQNKQPHQNYQQTKIKQWLQNNIKSKLFQVQQLVNEKLKQIGSKVCKLQNNIKHRKSTNLDSSQISISRRKLSIVSPLKRPSISTRKQQNSMFYTPASFKQNSQSHQTIDHLKQKLSSSKNNIVQLLKKNQNLLQQNYQYKKAYDEMLKTQSSPFTNIVIGEDNNNSSNRLKEVIKKLQEQNRDLKLKNISLEKAFTNMKQSQKHNLSESGYQKSLNINSSQTKKYQKIIYDLEDKLSQLKFENQQLRKHFLSFNKKDTSQNQINNHAHNLQQQNCRLNNQLALFQQQINKLQQKIQFIEKQKHDYIKHSQHTQISHSKSVQNEDIRVRDEQILRLQSQLNHLIQQSQFNKQQVNEIIDMKNVMNQFKIKLEQADRAIQQMQSNGIKHEVQVEGSLKDLESVKRMLQSINFNQLQSNIQELGNKYKTAVNDKINSLHSLNTKISQINKLNNQNEKNKLSAFQLNNKYVNQKSERERLQSLLKHQQTEVQILQEQIKNLNDVMNEYINKNQAKIKKDTQKHQNQLTQINQEVIDDKTQTNILHLKQLEREFLVVSKRLEQVMGKMKNNLKENKQFTQSRVKTYQIS